MAFNFLQQVQANSSDRSLQTLEKSRSKWQCKLEPRGGIRVLRTLRIERFGSVADANNHEDAERICFQLSLSIFDS